MSTSKTVGLLLGIAVFVFAVMSVTAIGFFHFDPLCREETIRELPPPDGRYVAVSMERNCGATTLYVEHINLRAASRKFSSDFFDATVKEGEVFTFEQRAGDNNPRFAWSRKGGLKIENACDERTSKSDAWRDVSIDYTDSTCMARTTHDPKIRK